MILPNRTHCKQEINATTRWLDYPRTERGRGGWYVYTAYRSYEHVCSYMFHQTVESSVVKSQPNTEKNIA